LTKRIELFRREDDPVASGVGLDAGGKASLNYAGETRLGDLALGLNGVVAARLAEEAVESAV
jgi:hypothetical protein